MMTACVAGVFLTDADVKSYREKLDSKAKPALVSRP
jgi:hypothetical protein